MDANNIQIIYRTNGQPTTPRLAQGVIANTMIGLTNQDLAHVCGFKFDFNVNVDLGLGELTAVKQLATALERGIKAGKKGVADVVRDEMKKAINELRTAVNTIVELIGITDVSGTISISFSVAKNLLREMNQYMSEAADALEYVGKLIGVVQGIQDIIKWISSLPENIKKAVQACLNNFTKSVNQVVSNINALPNQVESSVKSQYSSFSNSLTQSLNTVKSQITTNNKTQNSTLTNVLSGDTSTKTLADLTEMLKPPSKEELLKSATKTNFQRP
jgi:phage-related protein